MEPKHPSTRRYPAELKERAVRLVEQARAEGGDEVGLVARVARQLGVGDQSLRNWIRQAEIDSGRRQGLSTDERARLRALEKENRELRRANEILKAGGCRTNRFGSGRVSCARGGWVTGKIGAWLTTSLRATATS
jgi:transposase